MNNFMQEALNEARKGYEEGGVPIGSVLVHKGKIIGRGHNKRIQQDSVVLHAEMDALENAGRQKGSIYKECEIYTTMSPCPMCSGAILLYGIPKVIIGENQTYKGSEDYLQEQGVQVEVLQDSRCIELMQQFITENQELWNEDIGV